MSKPVKAIGAGSTVGSIIGSAAGAAVGTPGPPPLVLPRFSQRPPLPVGHVFLRSAQPAAEVIAPLSGSPRPTGGTGGYAARDRDRRVGSVGYDRTPTPGWEMDLVFGQHGGESVAPEMAAMDALTRASLTGGPPILAVVGPLISGYYVVASAERTAIEFAADGVTPILADYTLALLQYDAATDTPAMERATKKAQAKAQVVVKYDDEDVFGRGVFGLVKR